MPGSLFLLISAYFAYGLGMGESIAKFRYVQLCRSSKTYGMTCFEVQQRGKGKKLETILVGVTQVCVYMCTPTSCMYASLCSHTRVIFLYFINEIFNLGSHLPPRPPHQRDHQVEQTHRAETLGGVAQELHFGLW